MLSRIQSRIIHIPCYLCGFPLQPFRPYVLVLTEGERAGWYDLCSRACAEMLATLELEARRA